MDRPHAFPRERRLKRRRLLRPLFSRSTPGRESLAVGVVRLAWRLVPRESTGHDVPLQVGFAPGRNARTNAGRTRLRRYLRETFRQHQTAPLRALEDYPEHTLTLIVLFRGREGTASADLRRDLPRALDRLVTRLTEARTSDADVP
ncbi:MAG: ribonuclease P [Bacteroidota bacterium]